ncbi:MAG: chloride channel protein [Gemmatimonadales bacterium]
MRRIRRTWLQFLRRVRRPGPGDDAFTLALAVAIGVLGAFGVVLFFRLIGYAYRGLVEFPLALLPPIGGWAYRPLLTGVGIAIAYWVMRRFGDGYDGLNVPDVALAVERRGGDLPGKASIAKTAASAITIGAGGSAGSEGPVAVLGAAVASRVGGWLYLRPDKRRLLVGAGAAAGISAAFNAPLAGAFFALEEVLKSFATSAFAPVVVSSVVAAVVSQSVFGNHPAFPVQVEHGFTFYREIFVFFPILGVLAGLAAAAFVWVEDGVAAARWRRQAPRILLPILGGITVGIIAQVSGGLLTSRGHIEIHLDVFRTLAWWWLAALALGKIVATAITLNSGGSGGVFTPSLFVGAALGAAVGGLLERLFPYLPLSAEAYTLVGMGAVVAAATGAPITAILLVFEITNDYAIMPPLMLATVLSVLVAKSVHRDTLYSSWLRRTGRLEPEATGPTPGGSDPPGNRGQARGHG